MTSRLSWLILGVSLLGVSCKPTGPVPGPVSEPVPASPEKPRFGKYARALDNQNVVPYLTDYGEKNPQTLIRIRTSLGDMKIRLYTETPLHRANFLRLINHDFFDSTLFYRVVKGFAIQGGDTDREGRKDYKNSFGSFSLPAEFHPGYFHKKGALAATRDYTDNPDKRSSPFEFYIVQGTTFNEPDLDKIEREQHVRFSREQRDYYLSGKPGAAHLDNEHTVFGEVISGLDVIDKITEVRTDQGGWPYEDVVITDIEILPGN
ncbi:MAG: peptidylprolyl isomerase [Bacteroidetes bacterium]|nr:peptidylprolyl isomerase [Bacteroidota bacterium]